MTKITDLTVQSLASVVEGTIIIQSEQQEVVIRQLLIDSRKLMAPAGAVFFAIKGERHDGHQYIPQLYAKGVRIFIVEHTSPYTSSLTDVTIIQVDSAIQALQRCAAWKRAQFNIPVIGITGSNAKTILKEWLAQTLQSDYAVVKSPRSYNSQVGVPLSVWMMNERHQIGIFEAGISKVNEMQELEKVIQPTIGIFTNIGSAHAEGFESTQQKIDEKLSLFSNVSTLIYCKDHSDIHTHVVRKQMPSFHWSLKEPANVRYQIERREASQTIVRAEIRGASGELSIPFTDEASIENVLHLATTLLYLDYSIHEINRKITGLHPVEMRLELKEANNGSYLIDDSYNNDLAGLTIALDFLQHNNQRPNKTIILSDLLESGLSNEALYQEVGEALQASRVDKVIAIGESIRELKKFYSGNTSFYNTTDAFLAQFKNSAFDKEVILIKGARVFQFEKIVERLQFKIHETVLEINLDALVHNLNVYRSKLAPGTKIMAMVKAFAYGSSSFEVAQLLQYHGIDYLAVAYADEGARLRENGITVPVMVMNPSLNSFDAMLRYDLEPEIYEFELLQQIIDYAVAKEQQIGLHIKLDTGMRRLGFEQKDMERLSAILVQHHSHIHVLSAFTHIAGADEEQHDDFTLQQLKAFDAMTATLQSSIGYAFIKHAANSSTIVRFKQGHYDMVRLGIGLYGVESAGLFQNELKPISVLKTHISQIKELQAGETVGYGRKGKVTRPSRIATIAIGYADGYDRRFSNGAGEVLVNGVRCPIIGNVCMDMSMVDVTDAHAKEGDEVIVFGENPHVTELASRIGTIAYEILTGIGERVKRIFYSE